MTNRITIRCSVCGCETAVNNVQPGRKIFCLHCGRVITDSYQPGMEFQPGMEYQQNVNYQQGTEFNQPSQSSSIPGETAVPPPPPPPIGNSYEGTENASEPPQPSWKTEPYIRVNWKRIGFTLKTVFKGICSFFSKRWAELREGLRSDSTPSTEEFQQSGERVPPPPDARAQQQSPEPETPFGYVDRRQQRMQQSFSRSFAESGAIPVPPTNPNYSQQRIDQSFTNSFNESGAIPVPPSNPNYSQQRIDQSFTNSFREDEDIQS